MTSLEARVEQWFNRLSDHVTDREHQVVEVDAGPLTLTHTFPTNSTHTTLTDALTDGSTAGDDPRARDHMTVHSLEAPDRDLILPSPVTDDELGDRIGVRALADTRWRLTWDAYAGVIRCFDIETSTGIFATIGTPEAWEFGAPFRAFLHWKAAARGAAMVHAATVVGAAGAALVVGPGGTGKSTTTLVGLAAGLATVGDDYVWVEPSAESHVVRSVYSTIKTKRGGIAPAVELKRSVEVDGGDKTIHFLADQGRASLVRSAPLTSVIMLREPDSAPARAADAMAAVVPSTALQLPYDEVQTTALLREVCLSASIIGLDRDGNLERLTTELTNLLAGPVAIAERPSVTVAMPVHNGERHIERAIESVLTQPGWPVHIVAVDDGSTDGSLHLLRRLAAKDSRLTVLHFPENRGVAAARNAALAHRRDALVALIDQDDHWTSNRLDLGWEKLSADSGLRYVLGRQLFERPTGELPNWVRERWLDGPQAGYVFGTLLAWRDAWNAMGPLNEALRAGADDVDWFARAKDAGVRWTMLDDVVLHRGIHDENASQNARNTTELVSVLRQSLARRDNEAGEFDTS